MNSLSLNRFSALDLLPGAIQYVGRSYLREPVFQGTDWLFREPVPRYTGRKPGLGREHTAAETGLYPFRKDLLWKKIIEDLPEDFLRFFFPGVAAEKDPVKKIEFMDKELLQLFPPEDDKFDPRRVDKLLKVPMRDGSALILHCEVQGYRQAHFAARMYRYFGRLWDKYPQEVEALAILTDADPGFRPKPYRQRGRAGGEHRLCYRYKVLKVLDQSEEVLEQSDNPFAMAILTTKAALKRKNGDYTEEAYFQRKLELVQWLKGRSSSEKQP